MPRRKYSYDSLDIPLVVAKRPKKYNVIKQNYYNYIPMKGVKDLEKMISHPSVQSLQKRLNECYRRLNKKRIAVTVHKSPRSSRRRSRRSRRSARSKRRSRRPRSHTRRLKRSPSHRSRRRY